MKKRNKSTLFVSYERLMSFKDNEDFINSLYQDAINLKKKENTDDLLIVFLNNPSDAPKMSPRIDVSRIIEGNENDEMSIKKKLYMSFMNVKFNFQKANFVSDPDEESVTFNEEMYEKITITGHSRFTKHNNKEEFINHYTNKLGELKALDIEVVDFEIRLYSFIEDSPEQMYLYKDIGRIIIKDLVFSKSNNDFIIDRNTAGNKRKLEERLGKIFDRLRNEVEILDIKPVFPKFIDKYDDLSPGRA